MLITIATITDAELAYSTGITADAIRKLVDLGLLSPETKGRLGRGQRRKWSSDTIPHASRIVALKNAGCSLSEAAAILRIGGRHWLTSSTKPEKYTSHPTEDTEFNMSLKSEPSPRDDDLHLRIIDGTFVFEQRGKLDPHPKLIARFTGESGLVVASPDRNDLIEPADKDRLRISGGDLREGAARKHASRPISDAWVNLDLCVRAARRSLLMHPNHGYVPT